jgi:hypothetical protein
VTFIKNSKVGAYFIRILLAMIALLTLAYFMLPWAAALAVENWLEEQGVQAEIEHVVLSPFAGQIEIRGFSGQTTEGQVFSLNKLVLEISVLPLQDKQLIVEALELDGLMVNIEKTNKSYVVAGVDLEKLTSEKSSSVEDESSKVETATSKPLLEILLQQASITDFKLCAKAPDAADSINHLCLSFDQLSFSDQLSINLESDPLISIPESIWLRKLALTDLSANLTQKNLVIGFSNLAFKGSQITPSKMSFNEVILEGLSLLEQEPLGLYAEQQPYHLKLEQFSVSDFSVNLADTKSVDINEIALLGLDGFVHVNDSRVMAAKIAVDKLLAKLDTVLPTKQPIAEALVLDSDATQKTISANDMPVKQVLEVEVASPEININSIKLLDSHVLVVDQSVQPTVQQELTDIQIQLNTINSRPASSVTNVQATLKINDYSSLMIKGDVQPFSKKMNMNLIAEIKSFDMLPLSPYIERAVQYKIQRGQVTNLLTIKVVDDEIDSIAEVTLDKFHLKSLIKEELANDEKERSLPIAMALDLLRDSDDRIKIKLPVTGHVNDPDFSLAHVMGIVFKKALVSSIVSYYTPYGLVDLATTAVSLLTDMRFKSLVFTAASTEITDQHVHQMNQMVQMFIDKPDLILSFCPVVTQADALALLELDEVPKDGLNIDARQRAQLKIYGSDRARKVKAYLITQKVQAQQIILCQTDIDLSETDFPEINIHF